MRKQCSKFTGNFEKTGKKYAGFVLALCQFHWIFFRMICCFLFTAAWNLQYFLKYPSHEKLSEFRFLTRIIFGQNDFFFLLVKTMCACIKSEITAPGCARLCHIWPKLTQLDQIGPSWTKLDPIGPSWTQLHQIGQH